MRKDAKKIGALTAMANSAAVCDTALLIPDAAPARFWVAELMTRVVNGATLTVIPNPSRSTAGKYVIQYDPPTPGRAKRTKPPAATRGPMMRGFRGPYRSTRPPAQRESRNINSTIGKVAAPARVGE